MKIRDEFRQQVAARLQQGPEDGTSRSLSRAVSEQRRLSSLGSDDFPVANADAVRSTGLKTP